MSDVLEGVKTMTEKEICQFLIDLHFDMRVPPTVRRKADDLLHKLGGSIQ